MTEQRQYFSFCELKRPADSGCWKYTDGKVVIDLSRSGELRTPGGAVRIDGGGFHGRLAVIYGFDGAFHAFANLCMNDNPDGENSLKNCSVRHCRFKRSIYNYQGENVSGRVLQPLRTYKTELSGNSLIVFLQ